MIEAFEGKVAGVVTKRGGPLQISLAQLRRNDHVGQPVNEDLGYPDRQQGRGRGAAVVIADDLGGPSEQPFDRATAESEPSGFFKIRDSG